MVDSDFLGVAAARVTYDSGSNSVDLVWQPWFTPSRTPLLDQRWAAVPAAAAGVGIVDGGARYPGGSQYGVRWNHVGKGYEASLSYFDGENNLPLFAASFNPIANAVTLQRYYPRLRSYGEQMPPAGAAAVGDSQGGSGVFQFSRRERVRRLRVVCDPGGTAGA